MRIITLLTDFGTRDNFVGVMKGVILKVNPKAQIVDISHKIRPQNIFEGAFLLAHSYRYFPKKAIHLVVVDPGVGSKRRPIAVQTQDYFFIGPDNGILSPALKNQRIKKIVHLTNAKYFLKPVSDTFHARDIFAPVTAYLSLGRKIGDFGSIIKEIKSLTLPEAKSYRNRLIGEIIYIDRFGNLVTNITKDRFYNFVCRENFVIKLNKALINKVSHSYSEADTYLPLAIFDSFSCLEIALNQGSAKDFFCAEIGLKVSVERKGLK